MSGPSNTKLPPPANCTPSSKRKLTPTQSSLKAQNRNTPICCNSTTLRVDATAHTNLARRRPRAHPHDTHRHRSPRWLKSHLGAKTSTHCCTQCVRTSRHSDLLPKPAYNGYAHIDPIRLTLADNIFVGTPIEALCVLPHQNIPFMEMLNIQTSARTLAAYLPHGFPHSPLSTTLLITSCTTQRQYPMGPQSPRPGK